MKKQSLVKFFVILFAILISTPLANYYFEIVPRRSLTGFKNPILPPLQVPSYVDGTFQADFDTWFHRKHGLWGYLVRLNNQFNFSIFHQISSGPNSTVLLGRHGFLFEKAYLTDFNHLSFNESRIESIASKLKKLTELLNNEGKHVILVISPSKIELNPEFVQDKFIIEGRENRITDYDKLLLKLKDSNVQIIDSYQFFKKEYVPFELKYMTKSGAHWNERGACIISSQIVTKMSSLEGRSLQNFTCDHLIERNIPTEHDMDLVKIANLWDETPYLKPLLAPRSKSIETDNVHKPKVMIVGTSFVWALLKDLRKHHVFDDSNFYYYFNRLVNVRNGKQTRLKPNHEGWKEDLDTSKAVIFEINQSAVINLGFDFLDKAIAYLETK